MATHAPADSVLSFLFYDDGTYDNDMYVLRWRVAKHGWSLEEGGNFVWEEEKGEDKEEGGRKGVERQREVK